MEDRMASDSEALISRIRQGDVVERNALLSASVPLLNQVAAMFRLPVEDDRAELVQEGMIELMRVVCRWDPARSSYRHFASRWARMAMARHLRRIRTVVQTGGESESELARRAEAVAFGDDEHHRRDCARRGLAAIGGCESLDIPVGDGSETFVDLLTDGDERRAEVEADVERMHKAMDTVLSDRQREIITMRLRDMPLPRICELYGVTPERARQIETAAVRKLRAAMTARV